MLTCEEAGSLIARTVDGEIGAIEPPAAATLRAHLAMCDACREEMAAQMRVRDLLASRPAEAVPDGLLARLSARLDQETPRAWPLRQSIVAWLDRANWRKWTMYVLPAAAVLVIFATRAIVRDTRRVARSAAALAAQADVAARAGGGAADEAVIDWMARPETTRDSLLVWLITTPSTSSSSTSPASGKHP